MTDNTHNNESDRNGIESVVDFMAFRANRPARQSKPDNIDDQHDYVDVILLMPINANNDFHCSDDVDPPPAA
ncbi:MAG: hypothetical protein C0509_03340 [Acinetobacter sp.]|nr:hypothetical protein [Acinetobacter sp.]